MTNSTVLALDLGTTSVKAALVDDTGELIGCTSTDAPGLDPSGAFDADDYVDATFKAIRTVVAGHDDAARSVIAISISSQRATVMPVDHHGKATMPAISWMGLDGTAAYSRFIDSFGGKRFTEITCLKPSPMYTVAKIVHMAETHPDEFRDTTAFVLLHDYMLRALGAKGFFCDPSNASVTGLLDARANDWSSDILSFVGLERSQIPKLAPAGTRIGALDDEAARRTGLSAGIHLVVGGGDQQCASLGTGCLERGICTLSMGTAASLLCPIPGPPRSHVEGLLLGAHMLQDLWMLEAFESTFGASTDWAASMIGEADVSAFEARAAKAAAGSGGVIFLPFLAGIGTPDFASEVRGAFVGLSLATTPNELARAVFEGLALETRRVLDVIDRYSTIRTIRAVGGMASSPLLLSLLADTCGCTITVSATQEAALTGAAAAGFTGAGRFGDLGEAGAALDRGIETTVEAGSGREDRESAYRRYLDILESVRARAQ